MFKKVTGGIKSTGARLGLGAGPNGRELSAEDEDPPAPRIHWGWIGGGAFVVVALGVALWVILPIVNRRVEARNLAIANRLAIEGNLGDAELLLQQAVLGNPKSLEARRRLAEFYQLVGKPAALALWRGLVTDEPGNDTNALGLAEAALTVRDSATMDEALMKVSVQGRAEERFLRLAASFDLLQGQRERLAGRLQELLVLRPGDVEARYGLAVAQLASPDPVVVTEARASLIELAKGPAMRIRPLLALMPAGRDTGQIAELDALADAVLGAPTEGTMESGLERLLTYLMAQDPIGAADAAELSAWLRAGGATARAAAWLDGLAPRLGRDAVFLAEYAQCALHLKQWGELQARLRAGAWGPTSDGWLMLAFAARWQNAAGKAQNAETTWGDALDAAAAAPAGQLRLLARLAAALDWPTAYERALRRIVKQSPQDSETWRVLAAMSEVGGSPSEVVGLLAEWATAQPAPSVVAEWILTAALNDRLNDDLLSRAEILATVDSTAPAGEGGALLPVGAEGGVGTLRVWLDWRARRDPAAAGRALELVGRGEPLSPRARLALAAVLAEAGEKAAAAAQLKRIENHRFLRAEEALRNATRTSAGQ